MTLILLCSFVFFVALTSVFERRLRRTTLWAGRVIVDPAILSAMPRGMQDAITPPALTYLTISILCVRILMFLIGTIFLHWYSGLLVFILSLILSELFGLFVPNKISFYLHILLIDIKRRKNIFLEKNDFLKANAAQEMVAGLSWLASSGVNLSVTVPTTLQAFRANKGALLD
jgi:hypothetical protein